MSPNSSLVSSPRHALRLLATYRWRWLAPTLGVIALAIVYAIAVPPTWKASQALVIRNEAANSENGPGKFRGIEELKNLQGTIVELAKSRSVLQAALEEVGPPANHSDKAAWPTERDVEEARTRLTILPPKGTAFGGTEVLYVEMRDKDRVRAAALNHAICDRLQAAFQEVRDAKAQSMVEELDKTVRLAKADLNEATIRLADIESKVGSDLPELRALHDGAAGEGLIRRTLAEIEGELRQARIAQKTSQQLLDLLRAGQDDPRSLLAAPSRLLDSQPALKRLKDGLVDAQIQTAQVQGRKSGDHPHVLAAKEAETEIGRRLYGELAVAVRGVEAELRWNTDRVAMLDKQLAEVKDRLSRLAGLRAAYGTQVAETAHRTRVYERAGQALAEARGTCASAKAASLIGRIDSPDTGVRPVSPGLAIVLLVGAAGGLVIGLGTLFLTVQPPQSDAGFAHATADGAVTGIHLGNGNGTPALPATAPPRIVPSPNGNLSLKQAL